MHPWMPFDWRHNKPDTFILIMRHATQPRLSTCISSPLPPSHVHFQRRGHHFAYPFVIPSSPTTTTTSKQTSTPLPQLQDQSTFKMPPTISAYFTPSSASTCPIVRGPYTYPLHTPNEGDHPIPLTSCTHTLGLQCFPSWLHRQLGKCPY
jgi:hypothetical protein